MFVKMSQSAVVVCAMRRNASRHHHNDVINIEKYPLEKVISIATRRIKRKVSLLVVLGKMCKKNCVCQKFSAILKADVTTFSQ